MKHRYIVVSAEPGPRVQVEDGVASLQGRCRNGSWYRLVNLYKDGEVA